MGERWRNQHSVHSSASPRSSSATSSRISENTSNHTSSYRKRDPSPPSHYRRRHRRSSYSSSSSSSEYSPSEYSSSEDERSRSSSRRPVATAYGRKLDIVQDAKVLSRNCQFVKKLQGPPTSKERPSYLLGDAVSTDKVAYDPRGAAYRERMATLKRLESPPTFNYDANSKGPPPPKELLMEGIESNIVSRSLLTGLIEAFLLQSNDLEVKGQIVHVQLYSGRAAIKIKDDGMSAKILRLLKKHPTWKVSFDKDHHRFNTMKAPVESAPQAKPKSKAQPTLKCSRSIACLLISYSVIPMEVNSKDLYKIFEKCRMYNVERSPTEWHVHLNSKDEVNYAERWKETFRFGDRKIDFRIALVDNPPTLMTDVNELPPVISSPGVSNSKPVAKPDVIQEKTDNRPPSDFHSKKPSIYSMNPLNNFYTANLVYSPVMTPTLDAGITVTVGTESSVVDLKNLPIFNRRALERQKAAEEAARIAAQIAAEEERKAEERKAEKARRKQEQLREEALKSLQQQLGLSAQSTVTSPKLLDLSLPRNDSGCARLEGFFPQSAASKKQVFIEDICQQIDRNKSLIANLFESEGGAGNASSSTTNTRQSRAQNRRLQQQTQSLSFASDLVGLHSSFSLRQKAVILGRSGIHSWGLFAAEDIESGAMVIEYVGEIIRHTVANVRELRYEAAMSLKGEMASSYFFRLDDTLVVDATYKGNLARFVNHSCDPSCIARILQVDGGRRIVMYAKRDIRKGEEITYDYKFPIEEDPAKKVRCLCNSRSCRGYLN